MNPLTILRGCLREASTETSKSCRYVQAQRHRPLQPEYIKQRELAICIIAVVMKCARPLTSCSVLYVPISSIWRETGCNNWAFQDPFRRCLMPLLACLKILLLATGGKCGPILLSERCLPLRQSETSIILQISVVMLSDLFQKPSIGAISIYLWKWLPENIKEELGYALSGRHCRCRKCDFENVPTSSPHRSIRWKGVNALYKLRVQYRCVLLVISNVRMTFTK